MDLISKICENCGKPYKVEKRVASHSKFCTDKCGYRTRIRPETTQPAWKIEKAAKPKRIQFSESELIELYNSNMSYEEIMKHLHVSRRWLSATVRKLAIENKIQRRSNYIPTSKKEIDVEKLIELWNEHNITLDNLSKHFGIGRTTILSRINQLRKDGVKLRTAKRIQWPSDEIIRENYIQLKGNTVEQCKKYHCSDFTLGKKLRSLKEKGKLPEYGQYKHSYEVTHQFIENLYLKRKTNIKEG